MGVLCWAGGRRVWRAGYSTEEGGGRSRQSQGEDLKVGGGGGMCLESTRNEWEARDVRAE